MTQLAIGDSVRVSFTLWNDETLSKNCEMPTHSAVISKIQNDSIILKTSLQEASVYTGVPITLLKASGGAALVGHATIKGVCSNNPLVLAVTTPEQFKEVQRRDSFRVEMEAEMRYASALKPQSWQEATLQDISEGGIRMLDWEPKLVGELLLLELPLEEAIVRAKGVVRRCHAAAAKYMVGIQFTELDRPNQHRIRKLVFAQQIKKVK